MGSGLILLVIVGAWLAVLVPMALRSHDAATTLRSAERFGDAMRVLSPRSRREAPDTGLDLAPLPSLDPMLHSVRAPEPRPPLSLVARRRRVLLSLLGAAVAALLGGLLTVWLLGLGVVLLALAVTYVVHLRRLAVARAEREVRAAGRAPVAAPAPAAEPVRVPARPAPAVRYEEPLPAVVGDTYDGTWSPVPVPPPLYAGKPVAPPRPPRVLDLTEPGRWTETARTESPDLELDEILEGRRAVGDW